MSFAETDSGSLYNTIVTSEPGYPLNKRVIKEIQTAIDGYYKHLISFNWHEIAQKGLVMQIDELMLQKKKKCIWLPCFNESMQGFIPKSGPIGNEALCTILFEIGDVVLLDGEDTRKNHMNVRNNKNIARLITDIIDSNDFKPREINMKDYFEGLE